MYKTKPIDYTGCNETIADHLRRGLAIECRVGSSTSTFVVAFTGSKTGFPYVSENGHQWDRAEPIQYVETKTLKQPVELMQALVDGGWKVSDKTGNWRHDSMPNFPIAFWMYCGRKMPETYELDESCLDTTLNPVE